MKTKNYHTHSFEHEGQEYLARFDWGADECRFYVYTPNYDSTMIYELDSIIEGLQEFHNRGITKEHLDEWCTKQIKEN